MNQEWKNFMAGQGAIQGDGQDAGKDDGCFVFESAPLAVASDQAILCDLSHYSSVVIAGPDAESFIQGQFTNDASDVSASSSQLSAFCNNKGRMVANFRLFNYQGNYFMSLRNELVETSIAHLQHFVLRAQVAIQDVSDQLVHIGLAGNGIESLLARYIDNPDTATDSVSANEDYIAIRVAGHIPRYEIFCAADKAISLWQELADDVTVVNSNYWERLNIHAGLPFITSAAIEEFVPQMLNMELINGVSFTKGCYTGQEIVARTHYLGKQKRRTYRISIESEDRPAPGDQLATETSTDSQYIGTVINTYENSENKFDALAVIQMAAIDQTLKLKGKQGTISLQQLPYSLDSSS